METQDLIKILGPLAGCARFIFGPLKKIFFKKKKKADKRIQQIKGNNNVTIHATEVHFHIHIHEK